MTDMHDLKHKLYNLCLSDTEQRISSVKEMMQTLQEAANGEVKSSMGDKYETSRAMTQLEIEKLMTQLEEAEKGAAVLRKINILQSYEIVQLGTLVMTNHGNFYLSISAGRKEIDGLIVFALSVQSPLGNSLLGKRAGDSFLFQQRQYEIISVV